MGPKDGENLATMAEFFMVISRAAGENSHNMEGLNEGWAVHSRHVKAEKIESKEMLLTLCNS